MFMDSIGIIPLKFRMLIKVALKRGKMAVSLS
jgi:hypothetical protein